MIIKNKQYSGQLLFFCEQTFNKGVKCGRASKASNSLSSELIQLIFMVLTAVKSHISTNNTNYLQTHIYHLLLHKF